MASACSSPVGSTLTELHGALHDELRIAGGFPSAWACASRVPANDPWPSIEDAGAEEWSRLLKKRREVCRRTCWPPVGTHERQNNPPIEHLDGRS